MAEQLQNILRDLCPDDYHYPASDMHLTLINLDKLLSEQKDIDWQLLANCISERISMLSSLEFEIAGLNVFPTTIFVEIYDKNGMLEIYRDAIVKGVKSYLPTNLPADKYNALVPGVTFTNAIRFKNIPAPAIIEAVSKMRNINIGTFRPAELELVTTNKLFSQEGTVINSIFRLPQ
jgi:hypothetical protein